MISKIFEVREDTRVTYINKSKNEYWKKWKTWKECSEEEKTKVNLASYPKDCILFDKDYRDEEGKPTKTQKELKIELSEFTKKLTENNIYNYLSWMSPAGFHVLAAFKGLNNIDLDVKKEIKKEYITKFECDLAKVSDLGVVSIPGRPHFKDGVIYKKVSEVITDSRLNQLDINIVRKCTDRVLLKGSNETKKEDIFKDYFEKDPFFLYIKNNKIKDNTGRDLNIFPNLAIACAKSGKSKEEIKNIISPIIKNNFPGKAYSEFDGWLKKAMNNEITEYNKYQINNWMKEHGSGEEVYDVKPMSILDVLNPTEEQVKEETELMEIYTDLDIDKIECKDTEYLVEDWIPEGSIGILAGKSGGFKTNICLSMCYSIVTGKLALNKYKTKQCNILYLNEENSKSIFVKSFIPRVKKGLGIIEDRLPGFHFTTLSGCLLDNFQYVEYIARYIVENDIKLLILDSLRRFFNFDENNATEFNRLYVILKKLVKYCGGDLTILGIHHTKKENLKQKGDVRDSLRGSSDIVNAVDFIIGSYRSPGTDLIRMEHVKNRSGAELRDRLVKVDVGENNDMFYFYEIESQSERTIKSKVDICQEEILKHLLNKKKYVFARKDIQHIEEDNRFTKSTVAAALRELKLTKQIKQIGGDRSPLKEYQISQEITESADAVEEVKTEKLSRELDEFMNSKTKK